MVDKYLKRRWTAVAAVAIATFLTGALTAFSLGGSQASAVTDSGRTGPAQMSRNSPNAVLALHDSMRRLWEEHVAWTRLAISEFAAGSAGFDATSTRLLQNQADIGNAFKPFFGDANGNRLTALLHDHITIAVEILKAAKAGDTAALGDATTRWFANANDIADFLFSRNPKFWPQATMRDMMKVHLNQTLSEANNTLAGQFTASVKDYDEIEAHILEMADTLSNGIIGAFPGHLH